MIFSTHTGFSITKQKFLTTSPEFMSNMFTALIYSYTCKFHMINVKKKKSLAHVSVLQNVLSVT